MSKPDKPYLNEEEREYYMNFNTHEVPGLLTATRVRICRVVVQDMDKKMRLDLSDDSLINDIIQNIGSNTR